MTSLIYRENGDVFTNARELHKQLNNHTRFDKWIERRINEYGFEENEDYQVERKTRKGGSSGRLRTDYLLTIDMAKELAMIENNEEGRKIRRYFINAEKAFKKAIEKLYTPINGIMPIHADGQIGYPRKELLTSIGRSFKNGHKLKRRFPKDCFNIGRTACVSEKLASFLMAQYKVRQMALDFNTLKEGGQNG